MGGCMQIEYRSGSYTTIACDMLAFAVYSGETAGSPGVRQLDRATRGLVGSVMESREFKPDLHHTCTLHRPAGLKAARLVLVGAGPRESFEPATLRDLSGTVVRAARGSGCRTVALVVRGDLYGAESARLVTEGALYGSYDSDVYKTREREDRQVERFSLIGRAPVPQQQLARAIHRGTVVGEVTNFVRSLVNEPANVLTPSRFVERALARMVGSKLEAEVLEREDMERLGMNALLAVSRGSDEPPKLLILRIAGKGRKLGKKSPLHALVGKGVTFDSGGISLKPAEKMEEMKADMAGGAAVLGTMLALAELGPAEPAIGLIPLVENLPSGRATKPGDVVTAYSGKTIEIINTDAEGRLILADAIGYARKQLGVTTVLDIATLTGACVVALGHVNAGMMGTDQARIDRIRRDCPVTGEKLWQLPIDDAYRKLIHSDIADMKNVGNRWGGAITAAKFLQEFAESTPWVHLDIAGLDLLTDDRPFSAKGATGFGVRTMVQLLSR
jgi:leucyl aminopeptidase